jgi:hypothetical protein
MKNLLALLLLAISFHAQAQEDAVARLFDHHLQDQRFTSAYISPRMFEVMAEKVDVAMDEDVRKMIRTMKGMRVVQLNGQDGTPFFKPANDKLQGAKYEELMSLREKGEQVRFYTLGGGARVKELVMVVAGPQRFLLLSMVGDIDLGTVAKLSKALNVQGADLLEKVKK